MPKRYYRVEYTRERGGRHYMTKVHADSETDAAKITRNRDRAESIINVKEIKSE